VLSMRLIVGGGRMNAGRWYIKRRGERNMIYILRKKDKCDWEAVYGAYL